MANEIETLKFNITASTNNAISAIEQLKGDVEGLKSALTTLDALSPKIASMTTTLKTLSNSANNVSRLIESLGKLKSVSESLNTVNFDAFKDHMRELSGSLEPLASFKTNSIGAVINSLNRLPMAMQSLSPENFNMDSFGYQMEDLAMAIEPITELGHTNIGSTVKQLGLLPGYMKELENVKGMDKTFEGIANAIKPLTELPKSNLAPYVTQLAKIPEVVKNIDNPTIERFAEICSRLATSLAPLGGTLDKIGSSFGRLPRNINGAANAMNNLNNSSKNRSGGGGIFSGNLSGLTRTIGKFWIIKTAVGSLTRGFNSLFHASADYVEALNLFNVAMGDATDSASRFADKVQNLMGIDKKDWMEYQGGLNMLLTGFDIGSEKAQIMSQNLTQLAYDYSSLLNVDPSEAYQKIQSAMSGQIKGLKEYGNNVSIAMVKQTGLKYGLSGSVSSWNNATQATMRYVTIMENAAKTNVYNDLARTIVTPANAMRILSQMCHQMVRAIGSIASVIAAKAIPYLQLLAQVITRVASAIASFFGFKLPKIDYSGIKGAAGASEDLNKGLGGTGGNANKAAKGLDKANKAAKKLKNTTQSWDELHVMPEKDETANTGTGGAGGGGAGGVGGGGLADLGDIDLPTYDFFKNLQNDANKRINELIKKLKKLFKPLLDSWKTYGKPVMDSFKNAWKAIQGLIVAVATSINKVWQNGTGKKMLDTIFRIIINCNKTVEALATNFTKAWKKAELGTKIIQNGWDILNEILGIAEFISEVALEAAEYFDWTPALKLVEGALETIEIVVGGVRKALKNAWEYGGKLLVHGIIDFGNGAISIANGLNRGFIQPLIKGFGGVYKVLEPLITFAIGSLGSLLSVIGKIMQTASKCKPLMFALGTAISTIASSKIIAGIVSVYSATKSLGSIATFVTAKFLGTTRAGQGVLNTYVSLGKIGESLTTSFGTIGKGLSSLTSGTEGASGAMGALGKAFTVIKPLLNGWTLGIGAAIVGSIAYAVHQKNMSNTIEGCSKSIKAQYEAVKGYREEMESAIDSAGDTIADAQAKLQVFDSLSEKLQSITDKKGYVKNLKQAKGYVKQINEIMPGTVKITKDGKVVWTKTAKEIKKAKDNIKGAAIEQAKMALYTEVAKKQIKLQMTLNEQKDTEKKYVKEANEQYDAYVEKMKATGQQVSITREEWVNNNSKVKEQRILIEETSKELEKANAKYKTIDKTIANFSKTTEKAANKTKSSGKKAGKNYGEGFADGIKSSDSKKKVQKATGDLQDSAQNKANKKKIVIDSKYKDDGKKKTETHEKSMQSKADKKKVSFDSKYKNNGKTQTSDHRNSMQKKADQKAIKFDSKYKDNGKNKTRDLAKNMQDTADKNPIKVKAEVTGSFNTSGKNAGKSWVSGFMSSLNKKVAKISTKYGDKAQESGSISIKPAYLMANGGQVVTGQMFLAREAGPELVGTVGNRSTVMNNDQIVDAVASGVASAFGAYVPEIINAINSNSTSVYLDGRDIARKVFSAKKSMGNDFGYNY